MGLRRSELLCSLSIGSMQAGGRSGWETPSLNGHLEEKWPPIKLGCRFYALLSSDAKEASQAEQVKQDLLDALRAQTGTGMTTHCCCSPEALLVNMT